MQKHIEGHVRCGSVEIGVNCDMSQLDEALRKMNLLVSMSREAERLGALPVGIAAASLVGAPKPFSRRSLLRFGWMGEK